MLPSCMLFESLIYTTKVLCITEREDEDQLEELLAAVN